MRLYAHPCQQLLTWFSFSSPAERSLVRALIHVQLDPLSELRSQGTRPSGLCPIASATPYLSLFWRDHEVRFHLPVPLRSHHASASPIYSCQSPALGDKPPGASVLSLVSTLLWMFLLVTVTAPPSPKSDIQSVSN